MEVIRRASHPLARLVRSLGGSARERRQAGAFLAEGPRVLASALDLGVAPRELLVAAAVLAGDDAADAAQREIARRAGDAGARVVPVESGLLRRIAPSEHAAGPLGVFPLPADADDPARVLTIAGPCRIVVAWGMKDPGNMGTLIRSTAGLGARGLLAMDGADPWGPKTVRASAGAVFHLPVARWTGAGPDELLVRLADQGFHVLAAVARDGEDPAAIDPAGRIALVLGSEVAGLPREIERRAHPVTIPIDAPTESLSVAAAGAILLDRLRRRPTIDGSGV